MARRYRYEYLKRKKEKERKRELARKAREEQYDVKKEMLGWIAYLGFVIVATFMITKFVGQRTVVDGSSMEASLHHGDNLIVDKISYRFRDPERYEIVIFPHMNGDKKDFYIKRIIGLPGETIQIIDGYVYIDHVRLEEEYGLEPMLIAGIAKDEIVLGEDEYFVLGDNRNNSEDSRSANVGVLHREELQGRAWIRVWPLKSIGVLSHE